MLEPINSTVHDIKRNVVVARIASRPGGTLLQAGTSVPGLAFQNMPEHGITFDPATAAILARAAELQGVTLSEYVRQAALRQAEMDLTADELTNARLLKLAAARSPPSSWFEENADLFRVDGTK